MNISFRDIKKEDYDLARKVHHDAYYDVSVEQFGPWDEKLQDDLFNNNWKEPGFQVVLFNNEACGYVRIVRSEMNIEIHELVIEPSFQNKGIATYILNNLIDEARENEIPLKLQVLHKNKAINLYKKMGFKEVGKNENHVLMEHSASLDSEGQN